ncbi:ECU05_0087 [Encephalitozoon cuniculi GB-M1]|uniref:ECU05_0087 protein n=1 Tax=Encephalitozoon cuniculi (strain GB-M1) TaxID=284813 RepID=A0A1T5PD64_ENCCU|nr:uncharacterized protein ECU05_0087 [Encephalitozoon cuniculi GB-M1]UYI27794.1 hypothetical protein J0A71_08g16810 [Encephalitozoon cuniculi]SKD10696.1 ECU05_0087 [Encephalitozoon cuniculi GB-M1]
MRMVHCILSTSLCITGILTDVNSQSLLKAEELERQLLNAEDILMMEHLRRQGFIIYPSKASGRALNDLSLH